MTVNEEGRPFVDLRGASPREVFRRVAGFLDELHADVLRDYGTKLILEDQTCEEIARRLSRLRRELAETKMARLESVVELLEDLAEENASCSRKS